ncbi:hypothetical protein LCGC14_2233070, partial [marine sediment metagenome]
QLAAMVLNIEHGFVNPDNTMLLLNPDGSGEWYPLSVQQVVDEATIALTSDDPLMVKADLEQLAYFTWLKDALDDGNNNLNILNY